MHRKVYLIGIGMGNAEGFTIQAKKLIGESDVLIGAQRMLDAAADCQAERFVSYRPDEIGAYLRSHAEFRKPCVLLSGDIGFYSGASGLLKELEDFEVELIPGISSLAAFCSKLKTAWEDVSFVSHHGREVNLIYHICHKRKTFALLSGERDIQNLCEKLLYYKIPGIQLHIAENLSYPNETIYHLSPEEAGKASFGKLLVLLAENPSPRKEEYDEIADSAFIRGDVPMTKSEVRTVSLSKLRLRKGACFYDIGAGTGSVSTQAALNFPDARVYAVEKKPEAVSLIEKNKCLFAADNVTVIEGNAPECLEELLPPTHVFIGGSTGRMRDILETVWEKNSSVRIVINAIALETVAEVLGILREKGREPEEILQLSVAKAKKAGKYHLMAGQNPITVLVL